MYYGALSVPSHRRLSNGVYEPPEAVLRQLTFQGSDQLTSVSPVT